MPLRFMATTLNYKKDPSQRQRLWLQLPLEERSILEQALKLDRQTAFAEAPWQTNC
jgi:hypothetical protein